MLCFVKCQLNLQLRLHLREDIMKACLIEDFFLISSMFSFVGEPVYLIKMLTCLKKHRDFAKELCLLDWMFIKSKEMSIYRICTKKQNCMCPSIRPHCSPSSWIELQSLLLLSQLGLMLNRVTCVCPSLWS